MKTDELRGLSSDVSGAGWKTARKNQTRWVMTMTVEGKPRVLIADDVMENLAYYRAILADEFEITVAADGEQALRLARTGARPDLILSDTMMPGIDGFELCEELAADPAIADIPVIIISPVENPDRELRSFEVGAVDYLSQPFIPDILIARMRNAIARGAARRHAPLGATVTKFQPGSLTSGRRTM